MNNFKNNILTVSGKYSLTAKRIALLIVYCPLLIISAFAQDTTKHFVPAPVVIVPDTSVHITEAPGVNRTMQRRLEYARVSQGKFPGYRIQVGFGQDRNEAMRLRSDVSLKYPNLPTYLAYQQPYFKICVGDFRTKLEAVKYLNTIKKAYPGAFMVKDKIYPPPINN